MFDQKEHRRRERVRILDFSVGVERCCPCCGGTFPNSKSWIKLLGKDVQFDEVTRKIGYVCKSCYLRKDT